MGEEALRLAESEGGKALMKVSRRDLSGNGPGVQGSMDAVSFFVVGWDLFFEVGFLDTLQCYGGIQMAVFFSGGGVHHI